MRGLILAVVGLLCTAAVAPAQYGSRIVNSYGYNNHYKYGHNSYGYSSNYGYRYYYTPYYSQSYTYSQPVQPAQPAYQYTYEIVQDKDGVWWWKLQSADGTKVLAKSPQGFGTKADAVLAATTARKWADSPVVVNIDSSAKPATPPANLDALLNNLSPEEKAALLKKLLK